MHFLTLAHRWMGVALCLFFACWFISGAVLIYHPFPSLSTTEKLKHSQHIDLNKVTVSPKEAVRIVGNNELDRLRLIDLEGQPVYVFHTLKNKIQALDAQSGKPINPLQNIIARKIAEQFFGLSALKVEGPLDYDQWIVPNRYDPYRPFYRVSFNDKKATVLYVSSHTGEVLQKTEGSQRAWNYIGAVVHWIYPTVLRKNWALWDQSVWWLSLVAMVTTLAGMILGVTNLRSNPEGNQKEFTTPYKGWLRYHHIMGLFSGIFVLTWIFSGWLSMDHGRFFSKPNPEPDRIKKIRSIPLKQAVQTISLIALQSLDNFSEIEFFALGGKPFVLAKNSKEMKLFKPSNKNKLFSTTLSESEIVNAVKKAWPGVEVQATEQPTESDFYGNLREGSLPQKTLRVILNNPIKTWVHVNMESGQIVSVMDRSRRQYRWLFNGLHSLDFPGLANRRPAWDILIIFLLGCGFLFSITSIRIGMKRLFKH